MDAQSGQVLAKLFVANAVAQCGLDGCQFAADNAAERAARQAVLQLSGQRAGQRMIP
ncbi:MAG: hypothetical protein ACK57J_10260 [Rubrivivax sp.]